MPRHRDYGSFVPFTESRGPQGMMAAYVLRLDLDGGKLVYATRVGVDALTAALRIKADENGRAFVTGLTKGPGLPVTDDAVQPRYRVRGTRLPKPTLANRRPTAHCGRGGCSLCTGM